MSQYRLNDSNNSNNNGSFNNTNSFNNINSFNKVWNNCTTADDRPQILTWLSPLEPRLRHQDIQERRVEGVGEWLLQTEEFKGWHAGSGRDGTDNAVLFCYGDPGVGKTYLSSLVTDRLCDQAKGKNVAVACLYFDFAVQKGQSSTSTLGALLKQVVGGLEEIPGEIVEAYEEQKKVIGGRGPQLADIVKMLQATSSERRTFICIDALDECGAGYRVKLLDSLNQIIQYSPGTRIFVTGRPHIRQEIGRCLTGKVEGISITPRRDDIIGYLNARLRQDTTPDAMDSSLEADILKKIPEDISEIFLLVSLNIDAILQETTVHRRREKLNTMTGGLGLGDVYGATLDRIKGQGGEKSRLGMAALMWISHSERPLKPDELCHALAVEIGSPSLNPHNVPSIGTLLACCQGLVAIDKEASTVRFIHFTLHEYLRADPKLFGAAHLTMAETCLSYLTSQQVKALSTSPSPGLQDTPFLEYSSLYWGSHAKRDLSDCAKFLALKLFNDYNNHLSAKVLLKARKPHSSAVGFDKPSLFSGLHYASVFGIVEIVASLLEVEGCETDQQDCTGSTPLMWAALNGHERVMEVLLRRGNINPDKPNEHGQTPLSCAAYNGHEGAVKMLLGRDDVNPDQPDNSGRTPLSCAAHNGQEGVVKMLLGRDGVSPGQPDKEGKTPFWWAARNGHEGLVKILLTRDDVDPDKADKEGKTPLLWAARNGHEGLVEILLGQGNVNPDEPDRYGQTPLHCAARNGHGGVVKILLGRDDVNPDKAANGGQTPLWWAARNGHEGLAKILLLRDVSPDKADKAGRTPLWCAAWNGNEGLVKMLLHDANPDQSDRTGRTPLFAAANNGHEGLAKILLERGDVNPDRADKDGNTPLLWAARNGHEGVVKMLLGRDDVNPDKPNNNGRTPLHAAARYGHEGVAEILLGRDDVSPDHRDKLGRTPHWWAAKHGYAGVMALLQPPAFAAPGTLCS